jgi:enoyl-CoA hydratase/carnithine racemase
MTKDDKTLSLVGLNFTTLELQQAGHVFNITLNRPERKNAINEVMTTELVYALDYARQERNIRVLVITGKGDIFCAGGDLRYMSGEASNGAVSNVPKRTESNSSDVISLRIRELAKPVICKIQGPALAGALLMICNSTHAIAAEHAWFSAPEIKRGIWPMMVMAGLFRVMPKRAGLDFIMRGERISARQAVKWGLLNEAVKADELDERVDSLAGQLSKLAPGSMQLGLAAYNRQEDMAFDQAIEHLREQIVLCLESDDAIEGIAAFLEKRQPNWD